MSSIRYYYTGPSIDGKYGIAAKDNEHKHNAVTMHFIKDRATVELLVRRLNEKQMPVTDFCKVFSIGTLADAIHTNIDEERTDI